MEDQEGSSDVPSDILHHRALHLQGQSWACDCAPLSVKLRSMYWCSGCIWGLYRVYRAGEASKVFEQNLCSNIGVVHNPKPGWVCKLVSWSSRRGFNSRLP